jgi:hypothetical protein
MMMYTYSMTALAPNDNPLIKPTTSTTLLYCANQLAQTLQTIETTDKGTSITIDKGLKALPLLLLNLPPSPTHHQCDEIQRQIESLSNIQESLAQDGTAEEHTDNLLQVMNALQYELDKLPNHDT